MQKNEIIVPFLKWAGGKRWLVNTFPDLINFSFNRYIEPFLGSAAIFFYLAPRNAILSDCNIELIETYQTIKDDWERVQMELQKHQIKHSKRYYYYMRQYSPRTPHTRAARLIYLNRTCWNGLYRVNLRGEFNVPIGTKKNVLLDTDDFPAISKLLENAELRVSDFEPVLDEAGRDDFVFVDPPYTVKHNLNGFIKYNEKLFSWDDQKRLRDAVERAVMRGAKIIVSNANHRSVRVLYRGLGTKIVLKRKAVLAGDASFRGHFEELLVKCY